MDLEFGIVKITGLPNFVVGEDGKPVKVEKKPKEKTLPSKNNNEFTGAARAATSFRECLGGMWREFSDNMFTSRTMKLTRSIISKGPGMLGERSFEVMPHAGRFRHLDLNKKQRLRNLFIASTSITVNEDRNTATLVVPPFRPRISIGRSSRPTHYRLILVVGALSDFLYTGGPRVYEPVNPDLNGRSTTVASDYLPIGAHASLPLELIASLQGMPVLPDTAGLVVSLGIELYCDVGGKMLSFSKGQAMRVAEVF